MAKVTVKSLKDHTNGGESYEEGDVYVVEEEEVANLVHLGMAAPTEKQPDGRDEPEQPKPDQPRGTEVTPMTIDQPEPHR